MSTIKKLKTIQADALTMFVKLHNLHWNIKGMQFYPIHEMTEGMYNSMATLYDDAAERVLQLGEKPFVTMADVQQNSCIKEESKTEFNAKEVLESVLADYEHFLKHFNELSDIADETGDKGTVGFADEQIAKFEKDIWMIKSSLA